VLTRDDRAVAAGHSVDPGRWLGLFEELMAAMMRADERADERGAARSASDTSLASVLIRHRPTSAPSRAQQALGGHPALNW
jgi:hypothetical protein